MHLQASYGCGVAGSTYSHGYPGACSCFQCLSSSVEGVESKECWDTLRKGEHGELGT